MFLLALDSDNRFPSLLGIGESHIEISHYQKTLTKGVADAIGRETIATQLTRIVETLQSKHIRHRDITAGNLAWDGHLVLLDFGWAIWDWEEDTPDPISSALVGTIPADIEYVPRVLEALGL